MFEEQYHNQFEELDKKLNSQDVASETKSDVSSEKEDLPIKAENIPDDEFRQTDTESVKTDKSDDQISDQSDTEKQHEKQTDEPSKVINGEKEKKEEKKVEMTTIAKSRLDELENAEAIALEEVKRERAAAINYRKRLEKQRDEFAEVASVRVLRKLLDASDDISRIIENGKDAIPKDHLDGIMLLQQRIQGIFDSEGVNFIKIKEGKTLFDPSKHEPILTQPNNDLPVNTIITQVSAGFLKGDRVLRPAKVIISRPLEEKKEEEKSEERKSENDHQSSSQKQTGESDGSEETDSKPNSINNKS